MRQIIVLFLFMMGILGGHLYAQNDPSFYALSKISVPTDKPTQVYGGYALGCIDGAKALPINGTGFQVMRLSRNRFWGHPDLLAYIAQLGQKFHQKYPNQTFLVGDMSPPVGGAMRSGHASHQSGLDVDFWLDFSDNMPLSHSVRETKSATSYVTRDMNLRTGWHDKQRDFILMAAENPNVERIFVNATLKKDLCETAAGNDARLHKIRPWFGHDDHIHVRLKCPADSPECVSQPPVPVGNNCSGNDLTWWFSNDARTPKPVTQPPIPKTLKDYPAACQNIILQKTYK
jgi:penicillin-insensitive murein DD-endopeptidase